MACRSMRPREKAGLLLLRRRHETVALRLHAEVREAAFFHQLMTVRVVVHGAHWPDGGTDHHRIAPVAEVGLAPGELTALGVVDLELLRRSVGFLPLHR